MKKIKDKLIGHRSRKYIVKNMQAIDWISDSLISAGENIIKSSQTTNSYRHEKNSI
ncbi:MAG TPA: hypothetical protein PK289_06860 [Bacteroidia bacterium]|nr:hypothetical protein [Bacteroidia bacterium]HRG53270.1 hypothetical protein [Bacteroidia bacterium]